MPSSRAQRWADDLWKADRADMPSSALLVGLCYGKWAKPHGLGVFVTEANLIHGTKLTKNTVLGARRFLIEGGWLVEATAASGTRAGRYNLTSPGSSLPSGATTGPLGPVDNSSSGATTGPLGEKLVDQPLTLVDQWLTASGAMVGPDLLPPPTNLLPVRHPHAPNARNALKNLVRECTLPFDPEQDLMPLAVEVGEGGDPWSGYLKIKTATSKTFEGTHKPMAVLRSRLALKAKTP